jgi:GTPase SAR1 family protein
LQPSYGIGVDAFILEYSVTNRKSFELIPIIFSLGTEKVPLMCELEKQRMVSELEGKQLALKNGICIPESGRFSCCNMHFVFITNFKNLAFVSLKICTPN